MTENTMHMRKDDDETPRPSKFEVGPPTWAYPPIFYSSPEEEINFLNYLNVLRKRKWQILFITFLILIMAGCISFVMPKKYKAEVLIMPISSSAGGGLSSMASQYSSIPLLGGALGDLSKAAGGKSKELVNILKSRTLTEKIINQFDLLKVIFASQYDPKTNSFFPKFLKEIPVLEDGVAVFRKKYSKVEEEKKSGLVKINVTMKDPALAAKVANRMVVELQGFIENNSLTVAKRNRIFLEEQLIKTRAKLLEAGKEVNQFYADNKISSVVPQLDVNVGSFQTSPRAFQDFLDDFQALNEKQIEAEANKQAIVQRVPGQIYLQFLTLNRELLARTYALLTQQYEIAKIEEAKEDLAFQVIDKAQVKIRPSSPILLLNLAIGLVVGLSLGVMIAFYREYLQRIKEKEANH